MWRTAYLLRGMWDLPRPGLEPMSSALAGGFLTTAPPGKSLAFCISLSLDTSLTESITPADIAVSLAWWEDHFVATNRARILIQSLSVVLIHYLTPLRLNIFIYSHIWVEEGVQGNI